MSTLPHAIIINMLLAAAAVAQTPFRQSDVFKPEGASRPPRSSANAAWAYIDAWDSVRTSEEMSALENATAPLPGRGERLTPEQRKQVASHRTLLDRLLAATEMSECDFGPRYDLGPQARLFELGMMRATSRLLRLDAVCHAEDGDSPAAVACTVGILHLASQISEQKFLISRFVAGGLASQAVQLGHDLLDRGSIAPVPARTLLASIRPLLADNDLYHLYAGLEDKRHLSIGWLREACAKERSSRAFNAFLVDAGAVESFCEEWPPLFLLLGVDSRRAGSELDRADAFFDTFKAAWTAPDAAPRCEELAAEAREGQHGLLLTSIWIDIARARQNLKQVRGQMTRLQARLDAVAAADATPR